MCEFSALIIPKDYKSKVQQIELLCQCFKYKLFYINLMKNSTHKIFGPELEILNPNSLGWVWVRFHSLNCEYLAFKQIIHCYSLVYH
jgi:hypothetical protein